MVGQPGFFELEDRLAGLSKAGDPLERLARVVDFEIFRADLDRLLGRSERAKGGRPPSDAVLMFKILVLQALYGMPDEQAEYLEDNAIFFTSTLPGRDAPLGDPGGAEQLGRVGADTPLVASLPPSVTPHP